jgi:quercetin dioxygenase-like cupin family protein
MNKEALMRLLFLIMFSFFSFAHANDRPMAKTFTDKDLKWGPCPDIFPKGCEIGILHENAQKKQTDIFLRVPGNYVIPAHTHTSAEHMALVSGSLEVKYKGEEVLNLKEGSVAYGPAQQPHQAKCISSGPCVLFISLDEPLDAMAYKGTL